MVVKTHSQDGKFVGLHIGQENVRRNFPPKCSSVELLLGHLHIDCELGPAFWHGQPYICDARLADWLESRCHTRARCSSVSLNLVRVSDACYRVELAKSASVHVPAGDAIRRHSSAAQPSGD